MDLEVFSNTTIGGCNFHFKQAINRNILSKTGKKCSGTLYYLHYLSYCPANVIKDIYILLKQKGVFEEILKVEKVLEYYEKCWLGHFNDKGHYIEPIYSPSMWSIYSSVI